MTSLATMTTFEAAEAAARGDLMVFPVGAMEQHGRGLPLATDTIRAEAVASRIAEELTGRVVLGPTIPVGVSPHHLGMAGTVSLRPATFVAVLRESIDSLALHGWRRFLVITGHGGNNAALGTLAHDLLRERTDIEFAWAPITPLAKEALAGLDTCEVTGHSGEAETSQMLHVAPDLVRRDALEPGSTRLDELDPLSRLSRLGPPTMAVPYDRLSANGVLGDPTKATPEAGRQIVEEAVTRIVGFAKEWLDT